VTESTDLYTAVTPIKLEYVWFDGANPWGIRTKLRLVDVDPATDFSIEDVPMWGFDGSSTGQATGADSDCLLRPVKLYHHPFSNDAYLVLCDVLQGDGIEGHSTNTRISAEAMITEHGDQSPIFGFEQEYSILDDGRPLGFPERGFPEPQGIYYCGVGGDRAFGREIVNIHLDACLAAGISIQGTNAEVAPGQWEYQIGGPGVDAMDTCDDLWMSRYLLLLVAEQHGLTVTFEPKCVPGDWNGAGCHVNFSTAKMRADGGIKVIEQACKRLAKRTAEHLAGYGNDIELRLTGQHETCSYREFKWGVADRTASVRIPRHVHTAGCGYLEDRRPNANCDPYQVAQLLLKTICDT